jgi:hypothetical protein
VKSRQFPASESHRVAVDVVGKIPRAEKGGTERTTASRVGRRARLLGNVEGIAPGIVPPRVELPAKGHSSLTETQFKKLRANFPRIDIDEIEKSSLGGSVKRERQKIA